MMIWYSCCWLSDFMRPNNGTYPSLIVSVFGGGLSWYIWWDKAGHETRFCDYHSMMADGRLNPPKVVVDGFTKQPLEIFYLDNVKLSSLVRHAGTRPSDLRGFGHVTLCMYRVPYVRYRHLPGTPSTCLLGLGSKPWIHENSLVSTMRTPSIIPYMKS
jgi:hypothetical protein